MRCAQLRSVVLGIFIAGMACVGDESVLGVIVPMTGNLSFLGEEELRGLELAAAESDSNWRIEYEDSGSSSFNATVAATRLVDVQHADVLWASTTRVARSVAEVAASSSIPLVAFSADPTIQNREMNVVRYYHDTRQEFEALATLGREVASSGGRVAVLYLRIPPIEQALDIIQAVVAEDQLLTIPYELETRDFRPIASRAAAFGPKQVIIVEYGFTHGLLLDALTDAFRRIDTPLPSIAGGMGFIWNLENSQIPLERLQNIVVAAPEFLVQRPDAYVDFSARYFEAYNRKPTFDAVLAYQSFQHVITSQEANHSLPVPGDSLNGPAGTTVLDEEGALVLHVRLARIAGDSLLAYKADHDD